MRGFIALLDMTGNPIDEQSLSLLDDCLTSKDREKHIISQAGFAGNHTGSADGRLRIAGKIRLFERKALLEKLSGCRHQPSGKDSDSQLLLMAYDYWGENFLNHIRGEFAFALWDESNKKLLAAKDHFGSRELYYCRLKDKLLISNNINSMLSHPAVTNSVSDRAIAGFLLFGDYMWLDRSITAFSAVSTLPPATQLSVENRTLRTRRYWEIPDPTIGISKKSDDELIDHFRTTFDNCLQDRVDTNRVSISLSGGLDSGAVATSLSLLSQTTLPNLETKAFTLSYPRIHNIGEEVYAQATASSANISLEIVEGDDYPMFDNSVSLSRPLEYTQPRLHLDLAIRMRNFAPTVIGGWSADNLLWAPTLVQLARERGPLAASMGAFQAKRKLGAIPPLGSGILNLLKALKRGTSGSEPHSYPSWISPDFESKMQLKDMWREMWQSKNTYAKHSRKTILEQSLMQPSWALDDIFRDDWKLSPDYSDPYLDVRMVELIMTIPTLPWLFRKHVLRRAMADRLPQTVLQRPKTLLGTLDMTLLDQTPVDEINNWDRNAELNQYVKADKVQKFSKPYRDKGYAHIDLRALFLNNWLSTI
jgi:asparagine synthase (glutamine-hydrolysing)